jgi:NAD(P)-dependent dehydrogenase (short-subunit alcohol dehydrogenase family)
VSIGRNPSGLGEAREGVTRGGRRSVESIADLADATAVERAAAEALAACPVIDVLVDNAGISYSRNLFDYTVEERDQILAVNLRAPWLMGRALAKGMIERQQGKIVNVSSVAASLGMDEHGAYTASKSGLNGLTICMTAEWAKHNIYCNAGLPHRDHDSDG